MIPQITTRMSNHRTAWQRKELAVRKLAYILAVAIFALMLAACTGTRARAGEWTVITDEGELTLTVSPDGKTITRYEYDFECLTQASGWGEPPEGIPIKDGQFVLGAGDALSVVGTFNEDGTVLSGKVRMPYCRREFEVTR
jgi:hypothetical protein